MAALERLNQQRSSAMAIQVYYDEAKDRHVDDTASTTYTDAQGEAKPWPNMPKQLEVEIDDPSLPLLSTFVNKHQAAVPQLVKEEQKQDQVPDLPDLSVLNNDPGPSDQQSATTTDTQTQQDATSKSHDTTHGNMPDFSALNVSANTADDRIAAMQEATKNSDTLKDLIQF